MPNPVNPKKSFGDKKPPLGQFPMSAMIEACLAHYDGDLKYGFRNWLENPVEARTYIEGALRHLRLYEHGESRTRDTNVHNLGAVIACCAILIDAELHKTLIDNRCRSKQVCDLLHSAESVIAAINEERTKNPNPNRAPLKTPADKKETELVVEWPMGTFIPGKTNL